VDLGSIVTWQRYNGSREVLDTISEYFQDHPHFIDDAASHSVVQHRIFVAFLQYFVVQVIISVVCWSLVEVFLVN